MGYAWLGRTMGIISDKNNVLIFHIKWSKTIQYGERKLKIPVTAIPGSLLCPVRAYLNMIDLTLKRRL
jgi:hypothetical protein